LFYEVQRGTFTSKKYGDTLGYFAVYFERVLKPQRRCLARPNAGSEYATVSWGHVWLAGKSGMEMESMDRSALSEQVQQRVMNRMSTRLFISFSLKAGSSGR
jgi:hypothetical protein